MIYTGRKIAFIPGDSIMVRQPAAAAIIPWYLSGGISAANCIAAYQPKGAADYAASKVNLANPGTYNAADGAAYPTWDGTNGWKFAAASVQYLTTGITIAKQWTVIARFSNWSAGMLFGTWSGGSTYYCIQYNGASGVNYIFGGSNNNRTPVIASGNLAIAYNTGYRNGAQDGAAFTDNFSGSVTVQLYIGRYYNSTAGSLTGYIQALAVYDTTLTAPQISALSTAMAAL